MGLNFPNPLVGAVVVSNGEIVGEGFYRGPGTNHAEVEALSRAGERAEGATIYLNLEPCCHYGMTPPCVDKITSAGVSRVVFSLYDPDARVQGHGAEILRERGIDVTVGVEAGEAFELNIPYLYSRLSDRPFVVVKLASTIDGKIGLGERKYMTLEETRRFVHRLRAWTESIAVGMGTFRSDLPKLDRRLFGGKVGPPVRILFDYHCTFPPDHEWLKRAERVVLLCGENADGQSVRRLRDAGAEVIGVKGREGFLDIEEALEKLHAIGLTSILVEGGSRLATSFIESGAFDRLVVCYAPFIGGTGEVDMYRDKASPGWQEDEPLKLKRVERFDDDACLVYDRKVLDTYFKMVSKGEF